MSAEVPTHDLRVYNNWYEFSVEHTLRLYWWYTWNDKESTTHYYMFMVSFVRQKLPLTFFFCNAVQLMYEHIC